MGAGLTVLHTAADLYSEAGQLLDVRLPWLPGLLDLNTAAILTLDISTITWCDGLFTWATWAEAAQTLSELRSRGEV